MIRRLIARLRRAQAQRAFGDWREQQEQDFCEWLREGDFL